MQQGSHEFNLTDFTEMNFALRRPCLFLISAFLTLPFALMAPVAQAETIVHKSISYFTIGGKTAADLDRELQRNGPKLKTTGARHPGATRIKFGGDVTYIQEGARCRVAKARVTVSTRIFLPRWKNRPAANPKLALLWDTLASDIRRHEERHAEIARMHARDMESALTRLPAEKTCAAIQKRVSLLSAESIVDHDKDQARFDRVEAANFEARMIRMLKARLSSQTLDKQPG